MQVGLPGRIWLTTKVLYGKESVFFSSPPNIRPYAVSDMKPIPRTNRYGQK